MASTTPVKPPAHLSARAAAFWSEMVETYVLDDPPGRQLLLRCCELIDVADAAREQIERDGAVFKTRYGEARPHPSVAQRRDAINGISRILRELRVLDPPTDPRIPRLNGRR